MDGKIKVICDASPVMVYAELLKSRYGVVLSNSDISAKLVRVERTEFVSGGKRSLGMVAYPSDEFLRLAVELAAKADGVWRDER